MTIVFYFAVVVPLREHLNANIHSWYGLNPSKCKLSSDDPTFLPGFNFYGWYDCSPGIPSYPFWQIWRAYWGRNSLPLQRQRKRYVLFCKEGASAMMTELAKQMTMN